MRESAGCGAQGHGLGLNPNCCGWDSAFMPECFPEFAGHLCICPCFYPLNYSVLSSQGHRTIQNQDAALVSFSCHFFSPSGKRKRLQPRPQQCGRRSNHRVGCFYVLPGCSSTALISPIYRTHCIQSTHLLRTSARQNHSLLIAVVSKIERTAVWGWKRV